MKNTRMKNKIKELINVKGALKNGFFNLNFTKSICTIISNVNKTKTTLPLNEAYEHILSHIYMSK